MELEKNSSSEIYFNCLEKILIDSRRIINKDTKITPTSKLSEDLGLDSLDLYEFLYRVESKFKIIIPEEKANEFLTIEDYSDYLISRKR